MQWTDNLDSFTNTRYLSARQLPTFTR